MLAATAARALPDARPGPRIIIGWSPPGICTRRGTAAGQHALTRDAYDRTRRRPGRQRRRGRSASPPAGNDWKRRRETAQAATITGYASVRLPGPGRAGPPGSGGRPVRRHRHHRPRRVGAGRTGISVDRVADYCRLAAWRTRDPRERARVSALRRDPAATSTEPPHGRRERGAGGRSVAGAGHTGMAGRPRSRLPPRDHLHPGRGSGASPRRRLARPPPRHGRRPVPWSSRLHVVRYSHRTREDTIATLTALPASMPMPPAGTQPLHPPARPRDRLAVLWAGGLDIAVMSVLEGGWPGSPRTTGMPAPSWPPGSPRPPTWATSPSPTGRGCPRWTCSPPGSRARTSAALARGPCLTGGTRSVIWVHVAEAVLCSTPPACRCGERGCPPYPRPGPCTWRPGRGRV